MYCMLLIVLRIFLQKAAKSSSPMTYSPNSLIESFFSQIDALAAKAPDGETIIESSERTRCFVGGHAKVSGRDNTIPH